MTMCLLVAALPDLVPRLRRTGALRLDLVRQESGNSCGRFQFTLDVADLATGWSETRSVHRKVRKWVFQAIKEITATFPFPILGINSDDESECINWEPFRSRAELLARHAARRRVRPVPHREHATPTRARRIRYRSASPRKPGSFARTNPQGRQRSSDRSKRSPRIC